MEKRKRMSLESCAGVWDAWDGGGGGGTKKPKLLCKNVH